MRLWLARNEDIYDDEYRLINVEPYLTRNILHILRANLIVLDAFFSRIHNS